ncbi:hypothetical protein VC83_07082 [Pseudogymnoascus destructans]|uniref:Uncharacterized protein n=2 Tax=Pseudogymnoascus destructans TaxID=655981 RepID=L8FUW9_PSED2|nr:uncharacterized protein VC83_07082 [Pseudogymnoascus destructans]ELR04657.1 hypothetical protein GMDG_01516 [Pseudogymnoascus destructans 20631-21]OAF56776.1 hypothetical protein VC83_07082 [Pseudogymnoascus destructans]
MPRMPPFKAPETGQTTLSFGGPRRHPGPHITALSPPPTPPRIPSSTLQSGGPNESAIVREFQAIAASSGITNEANSDIETGLVRMRKSYTREQKLRAIQYATTTMVIRNGKAQIISRYEASGKLGITPIMLKKWIESKETIASQNKASRRAKFKVQLGQEPEMEKHLVELFTSARASG